MSLIEVKIGTTKYKIPCKDNEEDNLRELAKKVSKRVKEVKIGLDSDDEKECLAITALMIEEELSKIPKSDRELHNDDDVYDGISENMENVAKYIEDLTKKISKY